jgi:hypothetical protein
MPRLENHDGWVDVVQVNGAMLNSISLFHSEVYLMGPLLMFRIAGRGKFEKVSELLGPAFLKPIVGRSLAVADFENDGDQDLAISVSGTYPELLRNDGGDAKNWLEIMLAGKRSSRDGVGTALELVSKGYTQCGQRKGGMSYMPAHDHRVHCG